MRKLWAFVVLSVGTAAMCADAAPRPAPRPALAARLAAGPEFKFDAKTPPMFLVHGDKDHYSPIGSIRIYEELHRRKIPSQLFIYANVSHGLGDTPNAKGWQWRIVDWIESIGF